MADPTSRWQALLRRGMWIALWLGVAASLGFWSPWASVAFLGTGLLLVLWAQRRGLLDAQEPTDRATRERQAKMLVTQILRNLTRVQVAYLCQDFADAKAGLEWLKRALPRGFRPQLDELHRNLETARLGQPVPALRLALRVLDKRRALLETIDELERIRAAHPGHTVASPVIFVVTEHIAAEGSDEPEVRTLAGYDPCAPTLLPRVDTLSFYSPGGDGSQIRGQAEFDQALTALEAHIRRVDETRSIYVSQAFTEDPVRLGVRLDRVPLGFVVGVAELV